MPDKPRYASLLIEEPALFISPLDAEIEILTDEPDVRQAEAAVAPDLRAMGLSAASGETGVVSEDPYFLVLRDAVRFKKSGKLGVYLRVVPRPAGSMGSAILCTRRQSVLLIRLFRHATRSWSIEVPRGFAERGETPEQTARREASEETGLRVLTLDELGIVHPNSGVLSESVALFRAELSDDVVGTPEHQLVECSVHEFEAMLRDGRINDAFTYSVFARARLLGHL